MNPYAMPLQTTTPMGWKTDRAANRKRRFYACQYLQQGTCCGWKVTWGRNSKVMVVSIGMFPPTPNPTKAVNTRMPL